MNKTAVCSSSVVTVSLLVYQKLLLPCRCWFNKNIVSMLLFVCCLVDFVDVVWVGFCGLGTFCFVL